MAWWTERLSCICHYNSLWRGGQSGCYACNEMVIIAISFIMFFYKCFNNVRYTPGSVDNTLDCYKRTAGRGIEYKKCSIQFYIEKMIVSGKHKISNIFCTIYGGQAQKRYNIVNSVTKL